VRFTWDDENLEHLANHGVRPEEAEEVVTHASTVILPARPPRFSAYGVTDENRPLRVIYDHGAEGIRVTTAYHIRRVLLARIRKEAGR